MIKKLGAAFFVLMAVVTAAIAISRDDMHLLPMSGFLLAVPVVVYFVIRLFPGFFESEQDSAVAMLIVGAALTGAVPDNAKEILDRRDRNKRNPGEPEGTGLPPFLEAVHTALIRSALDMLKTAEQFKPFGIVFQATGEVALFTPGGANLWEVLLNLKEGFRQSAASGELKAGGICIQNIYENPQTGKTECSLSCFLETTGGLAVRATVPYSKDRQGQVEVEYADMASGQLPIIFRNDPQENLFSDQHVCYSLANELIDPYLLYQDRPSPDLGASQVAIDIARGIELLHRVIGITPDEPGPLFLLAKTYQVVGNSEGEHEAFTRLATLLPDDPDVARELTHAALMLGKTDEALIAANRAAEMKPGDPGILANLALTCLIAGQIPDAIQAVTRSLKISPSDPTSRNLVMATRAIVAKKWPQPRNLAELNELFSSSDLQTS